MEALGSRRCRADFFRSGGCERRSQEQRNRNRNQHQTGTKELEPVGRPSAATRSTQPAVAGRLAAIPRARAVTQSPLSVTFLTFARIVRSYTSQLAAVCRTAVSRRNHAKKQMVWIGRGDGCAGDVRHGAAVGPTARKSDQARPGEADQPGVRRGDVPELLRRMPWRRRQRQWAGGYLIEGRSD